MHAHDDDYRDEGEPGALKEVVITIVAALLLAFVVQAFLVKPYRIPSASMENTLHCGDRVLVDRVSYRFGDPKRFDVVVFHPPAGRDESGNTDPDSIAGEDERRRRPGAGDSTAGGNARELARSKVNYIKRIIGLPGDRVEVHQHRASVNGKALKEPFLHPLPRDVPMDNMSQWGPYIVPEGTYFMMGDHRDNSADSRVFGAVPDDFLIGKAFMVYWPPKRLGGLPKKDPGGADSGQPDPACIEAAPVPPGGTGG